MKKAVSVCIALLGVIFCLGFGAMDSSAAQTGSDKGKETPMAAYGARRVQGRNLVNEKGEKVQLYGMSTHGISWFPQFVSFWMKKSRSWQDLRIWARSGPRRGFGKQ